MGGKQRVPDKMIRHDIQHDIATAHKALRLARELCMCVKVLDEIATAHGRILEVADKLGIELGEFDDNH